jgi:hypothetical protein
MTSDRDVQTTVALINAVRPASLQGAATAPSGLRASPATAGQVCLLTNALIASTQLCAGRCITPRGSRSTFRSLGSALPRGGDRPFAARERAAAHRARYFRKVDRDLCLSSEMRSRFIEDRRADYPATIMCGVLGVSPAGYYAGRARLESQRATANCEFVDDIKRVHRDTDGRYGSPRVHAESPVWQTLIDAAQQSGDITSVNHRSAPQWLHARLRAEMFDVSAAHIN